jgi:hypothetical protein
VKLFAFFMSVTLSGAAFAQDAPLQVFRSVQAQKGEWQVEVLEGARPAKAPQTVCAEDPLAAVSYEKRPSKCKKRLLKNTADETIREEICPNGSGTVFLKREGKSVLMNTSSSGSNGTQKSKWRFTALGACRELKKGKAA